MKKAKRHAVRPEEKTIGTRIVEKYRPRMNDLTEAERKQLMREGVVVINGTPAEPSIRLTPRQLRRLADRMVASNDPAEVARLKAELERGFYGDPVHA